MTTLRLLEVIRQAFLDDGVSKPGWSDDVLTELLNVAEREACRRANVLIDETTVTDNDSLPLCSLSIVSETSSYAISKKIIRIVRMELSSDGSVIFPVLEDALDRAIFGWSIETGKITNFIDKGTGIIRLYRIPIANDTASLKVSRYPLSDRSFQDADDCPEIPEEYHLDLVDGVCELAYMNQDAEIADPDKVLLHKNRFEQRFGPRKSAKVEMLLKRGGHREARPKQFGFI